MATIKIMTGDEAVDIFTEPVAGDVRLFSMLVAFVLIGLVLSTVIDLNGPDFRNQPTTKTVRVIRGGRQIARRKAA